jgi:hypothetical protein
MTTEAAAKPNPLSIKTDEFRVSFPKVFKPEGFAGSTEKAKYSIDMMFDPSSPTINELKRICVLAAKKDWGDDQAKWPKGIKWPKFQDGNEKKDLAGYAGKIIVRASSKQKPGIVNEKVQRLGEEWNNTDQFYGGCYAIATVRAYTYNYREAQGGPVISRGVSLSLETAQKTRNGEPFSGRQDPEKIYSPIDNDETSTDNSEAQDNAFPF